MIIKSKRIYMEDGIHDGFLVIGEGKIKEFRKQSDVNDTAEDKGIIDFGEQRVIPGIIDTHNHGTCGYGLLNDVGKEDIKGYLKGCASQGITGIFPTTVRNGIEAVAVAAKEGYSGAEILGIHSEGPWLNRVGEKGVKTGWPEVSLETAKKMVRDGNGLLKLVALAPEIPGIDAVISYFLNHGIVLACAHSDCNYEATMAAYTKGLSVATHTGNVMTGLHHRDVGGLGAALLNEQIECEVICDGMHISMEMLKIYFGVKDTSRFMMISDSTPFSGAPAGIYKGFMQDMEITVREDGFVLSDTGRLMGSSQPVLYGIKNLVENLKIPLETVLRMSSFNAARKYGFEQVKGSLRVGKDADFVVIDDNYVTMHTYVKGKSVYDRGKDGVIFNSRFLK